MFLAGGPAFSGTTLLALLLNQNGIVCLDEPDFHKPEQSHRGIPFLQQLFPDLTFPERPTTPLAYDATVRLIQRCESAIAPRRLGIKTCDWVFLGYADAYQALGFPVIAIFRDIRDALVRPLPPWVTEDSLNQIYRRIWGQRERFDLWVRYEELVQAPEQVMARIGRSLGRELHAVDSWDTSAVPQTMLKLDRHDLLRAGAISPTRIGLWRTAGVPISRKSQRTAKMMGYEG